MRVVVRSISIPSYVWKYFRRYKCSAQCLLCNKAFAYSGGTMVGLPTVVLLGLFIEYSNIRSFWGYSIRCDLEYSF